MVDFAIDMAILCCNEQIPHRGIETPTERARRSPPEVATSKSRTEGLKPRQPVPPTNRGAVATSKSRTEGLKLVVTRVVYDDDLGCNEQIPHRGIETIAAASSSSSWITVATSKSRTEGLKLDELARGSGVQHWLQRANPAQRD